MGMFKPDFYRFFAVGFAAGALMVGVTLGGGQVGQVVANGVAPAAVAATAAR
jgi:hypothetical protein